MGNESKYDLAAPTFTGITIPATYTDADAISNALGAATVNTNCVDFVGTYSPVGIYTTEKTNLYLGPANTLYHPTDEGFKVNTFRAYFKLKNGLTAGNPASPNQNIPVRAFTLNFGNGDTSGIVDVEAKASLFTLHSSFSEWYTLDGRRLNGKPSQSGVYVNGDRKVVIK